jgi:hypothetical protein
MFLGKGVKDGWENQSLMVSSLTVLPRVTYSQQPFSVASIVVTARLGGGRGRGSLL